MRRILARAEPDRTAFTLREILETHHAEVFVDRNHRKPTRQESLVAFNAYVAVILAHRSTGLVQMLELTARDGNGKPQYLGYDTTPSGKVPNEVLAGNQCEQYQDYREIATLLIHLHGIGATTAKELTQGHWNGLSLSMTPLTALQGMMRASAYDFCYETASAQLSTSNNSNKWKGLARDLWILANLPGDLEHALWSNWAVFRLHKDLESLLSSTWFTLDKPLEQEETSAAHQVRNRVLVTDRDRRSISANVTMRAQADSAVKSGMCIKVFRVDTLVTVLTESGLKSLEATRSVSGSALALPTCLTAVHQSLMEGMVNEIRADVAGDTGKPVDFFQDIDAVLYKGILDRFEVPPIMTVPKATRAELAAYFSREMIAERRAQDDDAIARSLQELARKELEACARIRGRAGGVWTRDARPPKKAKANTAAETKAIEDGKFYFILFFVLRH